MENNVVTLETAKKLKVAGFPQGLDEPQYTWVIWFEGTNDLSGWR